MKVSLNFLDRWEHSIFRRYNGEHIPFSSLMFKIVLGMTFIVACAIVIPQVFGVDKKIPDIIAYIVFGSCFLYVCYKIYLGIRPLPEILPKIGYGAYILGFFLLTSYVFFIISAFLVLILLVLLGIFLVLMILSFAAGGSSSSSRGKKSVTVHYNDGTSDKMDEEGRGICGETYYRSKDTGNTYVD